MRERKEAVALLEDQAERRAGFFQCPECLQHFETPEGLGSHLERHREVLPPSEPDRAGNPTSRPCPKNCGRHFAIRRGAADLNAHLALCDGSSPIAAVVDEPKKEDQVAKLECPHCGKKYLRGGSKFEKHVEGCSDGSVEETPDLPATRSTAKASEGAGGGDGALAALLKSEGDLSIKDHTLAMLESIETHYEGKLKQVKVLISAVRNASEVEG
ncbi:MAG TPA: hypothetical protein VG457_02950 [Planctomycetota bacterium]|nr:hypothetical protein [Planctomycetota bacterium]